MRANLRIRESGRAARNAASRQISASGDARFTRSIVCHAFHRIATAPNAGHSTVDVSAARLCGSPRRSHYHTFSSTDDDAKVDLTTVIVRPGIARFLAS
ncbi:hypothetical protein [Burkholderia multivorans]|uniref:hypothetical protein n=1 Tax=Burkholderia multivorans TaxID=87883 RepID=UPI001C220349|nr:hypothetical protein [Burkholderia multivorans]MBU9402038.1 hypothetical protein [Burkholderia multivorans]MDN8049055.1 hypothetical protein [Burkholderia multivorans]